MLCASAEIPQNRNCSTDGAHAESLVFVAWTTSTEAHIYWLWIKHVIYHMCMFTTCCLYNKEKQQNTTE